MKKITIKSTIDNREWGTGGIYTDAEINIFLENINKGKYGKPRRWVKETDLIDYEKLVTPITWKTIVVNGINIKEYELPADYTVTITDYVEDYVTKRLKEYPSIEECVHALLENFAGNPIPLEELIEYRNIIKNKYPKP